MGIWDCVENALNVVSPFVDDLIPTAVKGFEHEGKSIPILGNVINGMQGAYHAGAGRYDALTGDRDGAITHAVLGSYNALGMVPGVSDALGTVDKVLGVGSGVSKAIGMETGNEDLQEVPGSLGDAAAAAAVFQANALFGKDDTNWIAPGNDPTGTRRGEIGAGASALLGGPLGILLNDFSGNAVGNFLGDLFGTDNGEKTSGANDKKKSAAQTYGQATNYSMGGVGETLRDTGSDVSHGIQDFFSGLFD